MHPLSSILNPKSVAIIGASRDPKKRGFQAVRALIESGYGGTIYPINPHGGELLGLSVATSLDALEHPPELAFISRPAEAVPEILQECARKGVAGAVVSAVGFRESGDEGIELERQIVAVTSETGLRLVGPNTAGVLNTTVGLNLIGVRDVPAGGLALLSQSGNIALDIINESVRRRTGISIYVGVGNEADIAFHEYIEYLETDAATSAIMMYVEGFRDGRQFIDVARRVSLSKPIILLKGGRSERGVAAARSHTGAIAGSYPVLRAALRQGGVSEVERSDELLPVGIALSGQPPIPPGTDVVVLADGGGHGTLAADALAALGVPLALLTAESTTKLRKLLGRAANVENPVDMAGAADHDPSVFTRVVEILARDPGVGGVFIVGLFGGYGIRFSEDFFEIEAESATAMTRTMAEARKPLVVHSLYATESTESLRRLSAAGVPVVVSLELGSRCIRALHARGLYLREKPVPPTRPRRRRAKPPFIEAARREGRTTLMETETRELLSPYGVALVPATLCRTDDEVVAALTALNQPGVLKAVSPVISHKTDAGGIALNVVGPSQGREAFQTIMHGVAQFAEEHGLVSDIRGVLVLPMLQPPVAEIIVGVRHDQQFGPVLTVGAGGTNVEILHDTALRGLPVGRDETLAMLDEIRIARLLNGYRGRPGANREALADVILSIAACALDHGEIEEMEANPVFAYADRAIVVDVRSFLTGMEPSTAANRESAAG